MNESGSERPPTGGEPAIRELYQRLRVAEDLIGGLGPEQAAKVWLVWRDTAGAVHSATGRGRLSIGRDPDCDVVLPASGVSRRHCTLLLDRGIVVIEDLESRNGTHVNGLRVRRTPLCTGDILEIGGIPLLFLGDPAESAD